MMAARSSSSPAAAVRGAPAVRGGAFYAGRRVLS